MFSIFLGICTTSIQSTALAVVPFEDNPQFFRHQRSSYVTDFNEVLIVLRQTSSPILHPVTPCQALRKIDQVGENMFRYMVYYSEPWSSYIIRNFVTTMTTSITALHRHNNVIIYQTVEGGPFIPFKVMYADTVSGCFIFVHNRRQAGRACRLLRKIRRASEPVPQACWRVYSRNCPEDDMEIYEKHCTRQITLMKA
uniref:Lipocalin/cytosolic fatty-acid binding domain-containing protein n=1 Tax=Amblyomma maculatum TaxID=34609 RepID=G3MSB8_AMBMU